MSEAIVADRLTELEAVIERGLRTFVEVGTALGEIRDGRLYRETHGSFEAYCRERWQMSHQRADQLIAGSEVAGMLTTTVVTETPATERVVRPLVSLAHSDPEAAREAWGEAVEAAGGGQPTAAQVQAARDARGQGRLAPLMTSNTDEWKTPSEVVARVLRAFPAIDLDPCAERAAVKNVPARLHYTIDDDGLEYGWRGRVFANPPYSRVQDFADKVALERDNIDEAIVLVPARTETRWWRTIPASHVCFFHGRLRFVPESGEADGSATFPSAALYVGHRHDAFVEAFGDLGYVYERVR